ncbi:L-threonylcarbamoyladenylate synthase [Vibrio genomosp. F10]|uniref:Threonylcarbamoyl-AMP synthase n=2 Tax=Vibrio genomosp. F10 TaxID=723171 RepID=A0A1B9QYT0_9VIBR|nr:L-threonylcarbamoyladenylate synthase [Vibrio genomosp. F10]OCH76018.1 threonylcarbamoyl-AMP synthase [Vibrio genomosp. F10]OEF06530.1 threonylcarbamoyl-AMP synthase [Vibrio genomosp. F10 str. 9ZB36]
MKTERLNAELPADFQRAGELLTAGELVAVPTETVYGLAADASNPEAVAKIFEAKQRPKNHPLIAHIGSFDQLSRWVKDIPDWVTPLADAFWPGPLTLIFERHPNVSDVISGGMTSIGVRMPDHPVLLSLLQQFDIAVAAPSANPYQKLSPTSAEQVLSGLDGKIAAVLDGGRCGVGTESTILRISDDKAEILRSGPLSAEDLQPYLPFPVVTPQSHQEAVSGNKKVHYQPNAKVVICPTHELEAQLKTEQTSTGVLVYSASLHNIDSDHRIVLPEDHHGYRQALYASLHALDGKGVKKLLVEAPPRLEAWADIWDRLSRAAAE